MEPQDYFVLAVALLAAVLAIASGWLRYDNANDEEETSEFWYDTGVVLGVLYMITIVVIYFAQTSHEAYQAAREGGFRQWAQGQWGQWGGHGSAHPVDQIPVQSRGQPVALSSQGQGQGGATMGSAYGYGDSFAARGQY